MLNHIYWLWSSMLAPEQRPLLDRMLAGVELEEGAPDWWLDDDEATSTSLAAARQLGHV